MLIDVLLCYKCESAKKSEKSAVLQEDLQEQSSSAGFM